MYVTAAINCVKEAGFDGVEIHGANGYVIDQFLKDCSNPRIDSYGGSHENRARFLREVVAAVTNAIGGDPVGIRFAPLNSFMAQKDSNPVALSEHVANAMNDFELTYVHVICNDFDDVQKGVVVPIFCEHYNGTLVVNGGYTKEEAEETISTGKVDAVAFGVPFIANPDLVKRFELDARLNTPDPPSFYSGGARGYNDYPLME
ncbi:12-oxophytodienoate reductase [Thraustotheca clavata]|uniref:12-oxophytodienoate reductase n=1 Tax=Thraustotheca clavata TaxID=74557 RepID=A0A1V9ZKR1_9STRA|nr:12-oxophytodienoate reductase [Thraustotheca clavata]